MPASHPHARPVLVALVLAAIALTALILEPFWIALFLAAVAAAALRPVMEPLARRLGGRRSLAAALLTVGVIVALVLPLATLGTVLVKDVLDGAAAIRRIIESEGPAALLDRLPGPLHAAVVRLLEAFPDPQQQLQRLAGERGAGAAVAVGGVLAATGGALFQTAMMLIALFFLLVDGGALVDWLDARVPLRRGQLRQLLEDFRQTSVAALASTAGTAAVQAVTATVGYLVARAPSVLFLFLATFVLALVPAVGGAVMVFAVALLLLATGHLFGGLFLVAWAVLVSLSDNVARPFLMKGGMELHGGVVFFAFLGGIAAFGGIGLLLGPLVLTFLLSTLRLYRSEFGKAQRG
jgi:predicted PurR-regulated permease PerM